MSNLVNTLKNYIMNQVPPIAFDSNPIVAMKKKKEQLEKITIEKIKEYIPEKFLIETEELLTALGPEAISNLGICSDSQSSPIDLIPPLNIDLPDLKITIPDIIPEIIDNIETFVIDTLEKHLEIVLPEMPQWIQDAYDKVTEWSAIAMANNITATFKPTSDTHVSVTFPTDGSFRVNAKITYTPKPGSIASEVFSFADSIFVKVQL